MAHDGGEGDVQWSELKEREGSVLYNAGPVASFELVDQDGRAFTRQDLNGKIWVVDFIFTHCAGPCPKMTQDMARMTKAIESEDVGFLSISVDPERDTAEVLKEYADRHQADPRWKFLTGDKALIYRLAADSFHLPVEDPEDTDQVIHSTRFVVVDQSGDVRAYHDDQSDPDPLVGVRRSVGLLLDAADS